MKFNWKRNKDKKMLSAEKRESTKPKRILKLFWFADITLIVALLLELFVFNFASFALVGGKYTSKSLQISNAVISGFNYDSSHPGEFVATSERPTIEFSNINQRVRTLYVDASTDKERRYELQIELDYTDSTRTQYNHSPKQLKLVPKVESTKYTTCSYFGETGNLKLTFQVDKGEVIHINSVRINNQIPFRISFIRILLVEIICVAIYLLLHAPSFQIPYQKGNLIQKGAALTVAIVFLASLGFIFWLYCSPIDDPLHQKSGDQVSQEVVDAFSNGQVSLLREPSQELLNMSNPYDCGARTTLNLNGSGIWDHVFYNGKIYSYYGIAPVLLLFLPYHLLTGYYFPSYLACYIFSLLGAVFLICSYFAMIRNWFRKSPFHLVICGLIILLMSCGILFCVERPMFYEMEEAAGFMFFTAGVFSLFMSGILTDRKIHLTALVISAICISLAVMSRPTIALYAVVLILWIIYGFVQYHKSSPKVNQTVKYFVASLLPYVLLGGIQMAYNYMRFGSFFEFGIRYSLTVNDFTHTQFYPETAFVSFWNLLFSIPVIKSTFPFFEGNIDYWGLNGYYFAETGNSFGFFWRALPLFSYLSAPCILHRIDLRKKVKAALLFVLPGLIIPIILILSTWESGHALRYNVDFAWQMLFLALAMVFYIFSRIQSPQLKRVLIVVMVVCTVLSVLANFALVFQSVPGLTNTIFYDRNHTIIYYKIARYLEFWY